MTPPKIKIYIFLPSLIKLYFSVGFLPKVLFFGVNQCISGHVASQNMEFITLANFKDRDFWFGPKNPINLWAEFFLAVLGSSGAFLVM